MEDSLQIKREILKNFDFAFNIDWKNPHHKQIHTYLTSLTMYFGIKMNGHVADQGSFLAYRFNERTDLLDNINKFRMLFKNESPNTFSEEACNGCCVFKI